LSPLARAQYGALVHLRWRIFINGLRSNLGVLELGARTVSYAIYSLMGLGLGVGIGTVAYLLASRDQWQYFAILFWVVCVMWQALPIMLASFQEQFDLAACCVSRGISALLPSLRGLRTLRFVYDYWRAVLPGILVGTVAARPEMFLWTALILVIFAAFNILLVRAVFAWIDRWLSQRKTREILGAIFMILVLSLQFMNPAFWQRGRHSQGSGAQEQQKIDRFLASPWVKTANQVQRFFPRTGRGSAAADR